ncbi:TPA: FAD-dependent thymidylate synthase [Bacillus cereus]
MKVMLISHTQLSKEYLRNLATVECTKYWKGEITDGQALAFTAIRTCYSAGKPSELLNNEGAKYFGEDKDINRLINHIVKSGHTSTLEGVTFNFAVEGVSRALLAQLTRHRVGFSYSVQSQRYVKFSSDSKSGGFDYVVPEKVKAKGNTDEYHLMMEEIQGMYDRLIEYGVPQEDARSVLPQGATCNLVLTVNLRALLDFYSKRKPKAGAQFEITQLAEQLKEKVISVEPWCEAFFM